MEEEEEGGELGAGGAVGDMSGLELGDLANVDAVAQLMRTLEGQVSLLDKKLE